MVLLVFLLMMEMSRITHSELFGMNVILVVYTLSAVGPRGLSPGVF